MKVYTYLASLANRRESGQGSLEYLGVIIVAVLIVAVLLGAANGWGGDLEKAFSSSVKKVTGFAP
jgi:Flp pilus assembly pilin Flp